MTANWLPFILIFSLVFTGISCNKKVISTSQSIDAPLKFANLKTGKTEAFDLISKKFSANNTGYMMDYVHQTKRIESKESNRIIFLQEGGGTATMKSEQTSKFSVGDIILLRPSESFSTDSIFSALIFTSPDEIPAQLPSFIRPDWDENITDIPGGCATENNAYRRILLTWKETVGPYVYHSLNAHRVRIRNSFSHYHPKQGGFDEFYLVQMAAPTARLITSDQVDNIENNEGINKKAIANLTNVHKLEVGDLVYLPRGIMHRGMGNVLAQVITVPGFVPGAEIGVDHHLRSINMRLGLNGKKGIPYNEEASESAVIK